MALINKIREKSGLAVGIITVGLILFLLGGDLLGPSSRILGRGTSNTIGEIAGESISLEQYQMVLDELQLNYSLQTGRKPNEAELSSLRQQAWEYLIVQVGFGQQYDNLGIVVTSDEMIDMVQGKNLDPQIVQAFTNPQTGEFDKENVVNYLQNLGSLPPEQQALWYNFEKQMRDGRRRLKYDNLIVKSSFVTEEEAKQDYKEQYDVADVKYLYVPYRSINDSLVEASNAELEKYLSAHKDQYQVEDSRSIRYVSFSVVPSAKDSADIRQELADLKAQFMSTVDDSTFAIINTEGVNAYQSLTVDQLPGELADHIEELKAGEVEGPVQVGNAYNLYKISNIGAGENYVAKASHILIKAADESNAAKAEAKRKAQDVLKKARAGEDFAQLARENSEGPTGPRGGDLGWFAEGRMVKPFSDAVFASSRAGVINKVVETEYGFHIIKVDHAKTNTLYKVAVIEKELTPSDETIDAAYKKADYFASTSNNLEEFEANAKEEGMNTRSALKIEAGDQRIGALGSARPIVRWAFKDAAVGGVSPVFDLDNEYVVAVLTGKVAKGTASLESVKGQIERKVKDEKKAEMIKAKLSGSNLAEMGSSYGSDAKEYSTTGLKLSSNSLPNVGFAPEAVGLAFGLEKGQVSSPIATENGVIVMELNNKVAAADVTDYSSYKKQLMDKMLNREAYNLSETVKEASDIKDERYNFF
ncbi:peptidylprolyl isomerase [Xanthovirga aplysinae]|uniref:peptidylprolyl isomerase n=1 Tax=Xanthovirga aplysinae TaxID=2529853 RepID=UPI0012BB4C14|nr:peptidylprolyl isomerase [Xanthovirga aplysinae]MTI33440.1 foldase [Xanthovirga aplysinae]